MCFHLPPSGDTTFISAFIIFYSHHLLRAGAIPGQNFCLFSNLCLFCCCVPELWECSMGHFLQEVFSHLNTQPCGLWNVRGHYEQREKDLEKETLIYLNHPTVCSSLQGNFEGWQESVVLPCPREMDIAPTWKEKPFQRLSRNSGCLSWYFLISLVNSSVLRLKTYLAHGPTPSHLGRVGRSGGQQSERSLLLLESHPGGRRGLTCQPCQPQQLTLL